MWVPKSEAEIVQVVAAGLHETSTLDAKQDLGRSKDIAKDIAAMANDGGVLLYGVGEDEHGRPTQLTPLVLAGAAERVTNIVQTGLADPPTIVITPLPTTADPAKGYLVVAVPMSPCAPHMVIIDKDYRFYGRTATGNVPLSPGEVDRLYARRRQWEVDHQALLNDLIARAPVAPREDLGYLHLFTRPVASDESLFARALKTQQPRNYLNQLITTAAQNMGLSADIYPAFMASSKHVRVPAGWRIYMYEPNIGTPRDEEKILDLELHHNGCAWLFCGRAAARKESELMFFDDNVAGLTTCFLRLLGLLYQDAGYWGAVDVSIAVTGIRGALSFILRINGFGAFMQEFGDPEYRRATRITAVKLIEDPLCVAQDLTMPLIESMSQGRYNPFSKKLQI